MFNYLNSIFHRTTSTDIDSALCCSFNSFQGVSSGPQQTTNKVELIVTKECGWFGFSIAHKNKFKIVYPTKLRLKEIVHTFGYFSAGTSILINFFTTGPPITPGALQPMDGDWCTPICWRKAFFIRKENNLKTH